jgi:predicted transcriptional regulator
MGRKADRDAEAWQVAEVRAGIAELDAGETVSHEEVSEWLRSWGGPNEDKVPKSLFGHR